MFDDKTPFNSFSWLIYISPIKPFFFHKLGHDKYIYTYVCYHRKVLYRANWIEIFHKPFHTVGPPFYVYIYIFLYISNYLSAYLSIYAHAGTRPSTRSTRLSWSPCRVPPTPAMPSPLSPAILTCTQVPENQNNDNYIKILIFYILSESFYKKYDCSISEKHLKTKL